MAVRPQYFCRCDTLKVNSHLSNFAIDACLCRGVHPLFIKTLTSTSFQRKERENSKKGNKIGARVSNKGIGISFKH